MINIIYYTNVPGTLLGYVIQFILTANLGHEVVFPGFIEKKIWTQRDDPGNKGQLG